MPWIFGQHFVSVPSLGQHDKTKVHKVKSSKESFSQFGVREVWLTCTEPWPQPPSSTFELNWNTDISTKISTPAFSNLLVIVGRMMSVLLSLRWCEVHFVLHVNRRWKCLSGGYFLLFLPCVHFIAGTF